ncbi:MAG: fibronectin type III domain-containing protein [Thermoguttaceae bacterium]|nr:fibronectin type III domain-containing protein [Thermoguttaceae bacterium]
MPLRFVECNDTNLTSLDVSGCTALKYLECSYNNLETLDVSGCTALETLYCYHNNLETLDVSGCTALKALHCDYNNLETLDVSGLTALGMLDCYNNNLETLDVSGLTALEMLYCYNNNLETLDVSGCTALEYLECSNNNLETLDVSGCTALKFLKCSNNNLETLDVSKNTLLESPLYCWSSTLENVLLPAEREEELWINLYFDSGTTWTFKDAEGNVLGINSGNYNHFCLSPDTPLPIYATNAAGTQTIVFGEKQEVEIVQDSIQFEDKSETRELYLGLGEKKEDVEDAFIGKQTSVETTLQFSQDCDSEQMAIQQISRVTWSIDKVNDDGTLTHIEDIELKDFKGHTSWDSTTHQLTITKDDWLPKENAFGNISVTCTVDIKTDSDPIEATNTKNKAGNQLRIGVTEYDVSFGKATVDEITGGVDNVVSYNAGANMIQNYDLEHSFDRDNSNVTYTGITMSREDYDKKFIQNQDKNEQWKFLVNLLVNNNLLTHNGEPATINGYDPETNAVSDEFKSSSQMEMIGPLLEFFSDYRFYVLLGKETGNTYDINGDSYIDNPESDVMRTIYVPSLADTADYSASDADVEIMARTIAYVDWKPGNLVMYSKWHRDSSTPQYQNIAGGGEIILTPYVVAFAKETTNDFQGYGLMNAGYAAVDCDDNFFISRGTEMNLDDVLADTAYSGVGYEQYASAKLNVINWIRNLKDHSVTLTGHSLGGALTQWFAYGCVDQGIENKIKKVTTFNAAGISKAAADIFNRHDSGIDIDHYISNGDLISFAGEKFIGTEDTVTVHLVTYRLEYKNLLNGKKVDLRGREVNDDGFLYKKNPKTGKLELSGEYGIFELGYKHGMWLANAEWRDSFFKDEIVSIGVDQCGKRRIQYKLLGNAEISIDTLNSFWFHYTQTGYLFANTAQNTLTDIPDPVVEFLAGGKLRSQTYLSGTTEQARQRIGLLLPLLGDMGSLIGNTVMVALQPEKPLSVIDLVRSLRAKLETFNYTLNHMPAINAFPGFDANDDKIQNPNEWWLSKINSLLFFNKQVKKTDGTYENATVGIAELSTLSQMRLPVMLLYVYPLEQAPNNDEECLLNGIYTLQDAPQNTPFGELFTLGADTSFTFSSTTYSDNMNNDSVELKADVLKLNGFGVSIDGVNYSEKTSGSSMDLTNMKFETGGDVWGIAADVSGKKIEFEFPYSRATANADLTFKLDSLNEENNYDTLCLIDASILFDKAPNGKSTNVVYASSGTFNDKGIRFAQLVQSEVSYGAAWKVSFIVSDNGVAYKKVNGRWVLPEPEIKNKSSNWGIDNGPSPAALPIASLTPTLKTPAAADSETRVLAFSWTESVDNPNLLFQVGNTVYTESEMIANGYLLLYIDAPNYRSYIVKDASADVNSWRFGSNEELGDVDVALQIFSEDITPAQVTSVNVEVSNNSIANVDFAVEKMSDNSLIQIAVCQAGQTEDVLNFYVPVSDMTQTSGGYSYDFDLAEFDLPTGDYQIYAWSDESMRENAAVSGSFHAVIESALSLSQSSFQFDDTNAKQESAVKQLTITNTGNGKAYFTLSLANIEDVTGSDFSISGVYSNGDAAALDCIELADGQSVTLNIQFTPQSEGNKLWNVELLDMDSSEKLGEFTLSGTGLAMAPTEVTIESGETSDLRIAAGDPLYASGMLKNIGENISDSITVSLYASQNSNDLTGGVLLGSYEGIVLEGQSEETIPFYVSTDELSEGDWYLGFVIECNNDSNTTNNVSMFSDPVRVLPTSADSVLQNVSATVNDDDNNGSYDSLNVSGTINVETAGDYTIIWTLLDNDSQVITTVYQDYSLTPGDNTVTASFDGSEISSCGADGPYTVSATVISDQCIWNNQDLLVTSDYSADQFESRQLPAPTLNVEVTGTNSVSVTVGSVDNASGYTLQYATNQDFTEDLVTTTVVAGANPIDGLEAGTTYYFRVTALGEGDYTDSKFSATVSATTEGGAVIVQLDAPTLNVEVTGKNSVVVTVGEVDNASGYTLQYATNQAFTDNLVTTAVVAGSNTIDGLESGTTYYFRIMATGEGDYTDSEFSAAVSATTDENAVIVQLDAPTLNVDVTGANSVSVTVGSVANASGYTLQYATDQAFTDNLVTTAVVAGSNTIDGLESGTTYYFHVMALGEGDYTDSEFSAAASATTEGGAVIVQLDAPTLNVDVTGTNSVSVTVGSVDNASGYTLQYATNQAFTDNLVTTAVVAGSNTITGLEAGTTYYFRIMATGEGDYTDSEFSAAVSAKTDEDAVNVKLATPALGVNVTGSSTVSVTVGSVANASGYMLQYADNPNFTNSKSRHVSLGSTSIGSLKVGTTYYFRVMAIGTGDYVNSDFSATQTATPSVKLAAPTLSVGESGSKSVSVTVGNVANASGYTIQYSTDPDFANATTRSVKSGTSVIGGLTAHTTYYFRVMATGDGKYSNSDYSQTQEFTITNEYSDVSNLRAFLEQTDSNGVKNGQKMNDNYDPNDTSTWSNIIWKEIDGVQRVTNIYWYEMGMVGAMDLSDCSELTYLYCYSNELTDLDISGCTALQKVYCYRNQLTSLDVTNNTNLTLLACYSNQLSELDLSQNTQLTYLACYSNPIKTLDISHNANLVSAYCWNPELECIIINPEAEGLSVFLDYSDSTWTYQDANGVTLATGVTRYIYNASDSVALPVYATNESGSQIIAISAAAVDPDQSKLSAPTLTVAATGSDSISVTVGEVENAAGYKLQYSVNPNFTDAVTENVSAGTTAINGLNVNTTYYFRALAIGSDDYASSNYCSVKSVKTECIQLAEPELQSVVPNGYGSVSVTVGEVENASGYALEYSASEDFSDANVMNVSAGATTVKDLNVGTTYYFRVQALGTGDYSDSDYSDVLSAKVDDLKVSINGKKVVVEWYDDSLAADSIRYRVAGTTRWTTAKLKAGVTTYSFNGALGSDYEIEVLLDQQEDNVLQGSAVVLDQPKLSSVKNELKEDSFQVNVTNYAAKNLAANVNQATVTVNGVPTTVDIADQQGESELPDGGKVSFNNGLFTFTEMASNTLYKVQVAFSDGNSVSTASSALTVKTAKTFYLAPTITSAVAVSDSCIDVTWETSYGAKSNIEAQKYTVQYSTDGVKWTTATTAATGNAYTIQKLKGGVEYQVRVLATKDNAFDASAPSDVLTTETLALPKIALQKNSVQDDSFQLNVTNYQNTNLVNATTINVKSDKFGTTVVFLLDGQGSATFSNGMTVNFNNGAMTFANVPSNTQQKIQINFKEGACTTAWSSALTIKTLVAPYNKPVLTNATAVSSTSIEVNWETVYGKNSTEAAQKYTVQYSTDGERWTNATTSATGTSFTITKLKANTKYLVAVIANKDSKFNASQPSESLLVTTLN